MKSPLLIKGMHGLGDNLHQRAIVRQLLPHYDLWLESSWVAPYVDLVGQGGLKIVRKPTPLRTQSKNAEREAKSFLPAPPPQTPHRAIWYRPEEVRGKGGVLAAMCASAGVSYERADFRLPLPDAWARRADDLIRQWRATKPILIYRPLIERTEWDGCAARNPHIANYGEIFESIRDRFFVVSLADLVDGVEWMVSPDVSADVTLHRGELDFEIMAALFARAALVYCSPGFAVILGQSVGTPVICAFGRYERAYSFSGGARFSPYLGIEPIKPCDDFKHDHRADKSIDLTSAIPSAGLFAREAAKRHAARAAKV